MSCTRAAVFCCRSTADLSLCRSRFIQHPKNFGLIASFLERKVTFHFSFRPPRPRLFRKRLLNFNWDVAFALQTVAECVLFYYLTKKNENYKNIVRRNYRRRGRSQVRARFGTRTCGRGQNPKHTGSIYIWKRMSSGDIRHMWFRDEWNSWLWKRSSNTRDYEISHCWEVRNIFLYLLVWKGWCYWCACCSFFLHKCPLCLAPLSVLLLHFQPIALPFFLYSLRSLKPSQWLKDMCKGVCAGSLSVKWKLRGAWWLC